MHDNYIPFCDYIGSRDGHFFLSQVRHLVNSNTHSEDLYGYILKLLSILFS